MVGRKVEWLSDLVTCGWCASGWVSLAVTTVVYLTPPRPGPIVGALIFWGATWAIGALVWDYWCDRQRYSD